MTKLLEGAPKGTIVDWNSDEIFIIKYQALNHAQGQLVGKNFDNAKKWLKENKDRYLELINRN